MGSLFQSREEKVPLHFLFNFMNKKILVWNCQGAASRKFRNVAKSLIEIRKPDMLVLLKPYISGIKAELLIYF